jgi:hypothetical protein
MSRPFQSPVLGITPSTTEPGPRAAHTTPPTADATRRRTSGERTVSAVAAAEALEPKWLTAIDAATD